MGVEGVGSVSELRGGNTGDDTFGSCSALVLQQDDSERRRGRTSHWGGEVGGARGGHKL